MLTPLITHLDRPFPRQAAEQSDLVRLVSSWAPQSGPHSLQYTVEPLNWREALKMPGDNIFKRMYWSALLFEALQVEAAEFRATTTNIINQQIQDQIKEESAPASHKRTGHAGHPEDEAGAYGNAPDSYDEAPSDDDDYLYKPAKAAAMAAMWAARMNEAHAASYASLKEEMGLFGIDVDNEKLTSEEVHLYAGAHAEDLGYCAMHEHLFKAAAMHADHLSLDNLGIMDHFIHGLAGMFHRNQKTVDDFHSVQPDALEKMAKAIAKAADGLIEKLAPVAQEMAAATQKATGAATGQVPTPRPTPTPTTVQAELASMGAPETAEHALTQQRLAVIRTFYPDAPKPQNTQNRKMAEELGHDTTAHNTHQAHIGELVHYAKAAGVQFHVLEKAADKTLQKMFTVDEATKELMNKHSDAPLLEKPKSLAQREMAKSMKPQQPLS